MAYRKCNISLTDELADQIDEYARAHNLTRSAVIAIACSDYMKAAAKLPELRSQLIEMSDQINFLVSKMNSAPDVPLDDPGFPDIRLV